MLVDPTVGMIVRVVVTDAVTEALRPLIVGVAQMRRHLADGALLHVGARVPDSERGAVALWRSRQVDRRLAEVELRLRQTNVLQRMSGGNSHLQR